jgi:hypothetical protein
MAEAAHPQPAETPAPDAGAEPVDAVGKNPFPTSMSVPGLAGQTVDVDLATLDGVVYAPHLDDLPLAPHIRQYVTQYCAAWSQSVLTVGKLESGSMAAAPPRRAQVVFGERQLHAMLGLAADETLVAVVVDSMSTAVRFVVESPRLPRKPYWDVEPLAVTLPIAAHYEQQ